MRFSPARCPECGAAAAWTVDTLPALARLLEPDADGRTEFSGESVMCWDGQHTDQDAEGRLLLGCGAHEWYAVDLDALPWGGA